MQFPLFIFTIGLFNVIPSDGRLIQKNKTRAVEEAQTEKPNPSIRLTRDVDNDSITGFSIEASVESEEFIKSYNKKAGFFIKSKPRESKTQDQKKTRAARNYMEKIKSDPTTKTIKELKKPANVKTVLVKKPIPKFYDRDYDDFQSKISKSHLFTDSGDHEDEDFNLDDYDFDINHDEFSSGGKPLEPRIIRIKKVEFEKKPSLKILTKVSDSDSIKTVLNKEKATGPNLTKITDNIKEVDYYDDLTTTLPPVTSAKTRDDEYSEENDDIKETVHNNSSIRAARLWNNNNINLFGQKFHDHVSRIATKSLGILPLFPGVPDSYQIDAVSDDSSDVNV